MIFVVLKRSKRRQKNIQAERHGISDDKTKDRKQLTGEKIVKPKMTPMTTSVSSGEQREKLTKITMCSDSTEKG